MALKIKATDGVIYDVNTVNEAGAEIQAAVANVTATVEAEKNAAKTNYEQAAQSHEAATQKLTDAESTLTDAQAALTEAKSAYEKDITDITQDVKTNLDNYLPADIIRMPEEISNQLLGADTDGNVKSFNIVTSTSATDADGIADASFVRAAIAEIEIPEVPETPTITPVKVFTGTALNDITNMAHGDFAIIETIIFKNEDIEKKSRTAYIYNTDHWEAFDGNYNANNIYFADDIEVTKEIGYITLDETGAGKIPAKDKNLVEVFGEMFAQDKDPTVSQPKIASFTFSNAGKSFEVGTELTDLSFAASFYAGNYQYGPATDISPSWEIKQGNNVISQEASGTIDKLVIMDDTNYVLKAIANYGQGAIPLTFKQKEKAELRIVAGSVEATTSAITGYRKYYYGPIYSKIDDPTTALTSELIKGLLKKSTSNCNSGTKITWKAADYEGIVGYLIAVPSNNNTVINKVSLASNSNQDITDTYKPYITSENIRGNGEDAGVLYNVWLYQPNSLGTDEEHSITFKNK